MVPRPPPPRRLGIDREYLETVLVELLEIPSPSGRTDHVMQYVGERLEGLGLPFSITRRGAIIASLDGDRDDVDRTLVVHTDTIGCMVRGLKENGRLAVRPIGTHSARFSEGAQVRIFTDDLDQVITGTILALKASGHRYNDEVDSQGVGWDHVEVRVDESVEDAAGLRSLGIDVGDFVALISTPLITPSGFVKARHLDDKAGVAAVLAGVKAVVETGVHVPVNAHLLITCTEEVGHGASHGVDSRVAEIVSVDTAVVAPEQQSREDAVCVAMADGVGPFDYHLSRRIAALASEHGVPCVRDVFVHYRSDLAATLESGADTRTALLGFGVDATHGHERTHMGGLVHLAELIGLYLQTDLVFPEWDAGGRGELEDFPSLAVQPANEEGPRDGPIGVD
ncbi:osmoprotectant NAGGN system M42 family peptidase [Miltoncostaea oceani]|uniref:osmoprotectant NAGGN system M42 family peptidase n=1 Tax=Miltoncostaea oceani TaxID=2843216 RepID=UPI001C3CFEC7|nr:osmoprotectant NAGGN system M42 family peptidase [Miltoncostaea oceani]